MDFNDVATFVLGSIPGNIQTVSKTLHWHGAASDGDKLLCLDNLSHDIMDGNCLVYSFGIAEDWTFEISMADMGCKVSSVKQFQRMSMYIIVADKDFIS